MTDTKPQPIEVWLTKKNIEITCRSVAEDESTQEFEVQSLSMRGAQREMTGYFKSHGYEPAGRYWKDKQDAPNGYGEETVECVRLFRPATH